MTKVLTAISTAQFFHFAEVSYGNSPKYIKPFLSIGTVTLADVLSISTHAGEQDLAMKVLSKMAGGKVARLFAASLAREAIMLRSKNPDAALIAATDAARMYALGKIGIIELLQRRERALYVADEFNCDGDESKDNEIHAMYCCAYSADMMPDSAATNVAREFLAQHEGDQSYAARKLADMISNEASSSHKEFNNDDHQSLLMELMDGVYTWSKCSCSSCVDCIEAVMEPWAKLVEEMGLERFKE